MTRKATYRNVPQAVVLIVAIWLVFSPKLSRAQDCGRNMLRISSVGSYVATPSAPSLNLTKGFTIECWDSISAAGVHAALAAKGGYPFTYGLMLDTSLVVAGVIRHSTLALVDGASLDTLIGWHHYALTFRPNDSLRFYVDGIEAASQSTAGIAALDSTTDSLRIGYTVNGNGMLGSIDELRIWNYARSQSSIKASMKHILAGNDSGLVLYYSFDDDVGSTRIHDYSGHGRDGVIHGINAEIWPSTSPMIEPSPGYRLFAKEKKMVIPMKRCTPSFDTVINLGNLGTDSLLVTDIGCTSSVFSITPHSPFTLPPDTSSFKQLKIHFAPQDDGFYQGTLTISSTDACAGTLTIDLQASYDSVGLRFDPAQLSIDSVTQCNLPQTRIVTLHNTSKLDSITIMDYAIPSGSGITISPPPPIVLGKDGYVIDTVKIGSGPHGPMHINLGFNLDECSRQAILSVTGMRELAALGAPSVFSLGPYPSTLPGTTIDTFVTVTNIGDVKDAIRSITASDTSLHVIDTRAGIFIDPGQSLNVPVRINAAGCEVYQARLRISSTICSVDTIVRVSVNLTPTSPLTASTMDVGSHCQPVDDTFIVRNPNDVAVRLSKTSFSKDSVIFIDPTFVIPATIAPHDSIKVPFRFFPMVDGEYADTIFLHGLPCGFGTMIVKGAWGYKGLVFSQSTLNFGRGCSTDTIVKSVVLTNGTQRADTLFSESYLGTKKFSVGVFPQPLILKPGESKAISFTYTPSLGAVDTGSFPLTTKEGCTAAVLKLRGSRELAKADWQTSTGNFGVVCPGSSADRSFGIANHGLDTIDVVNASISGSGFTIVRSPRTIGKTDSVTIRFAPSAHQSYSATLKLVLDSCGTSISLPLTGSSGADPTIVVADTAYDFGSIKIGDSSQICIAITNPSCTPLSLRIDSSAVYGAFTISGNNHKTEIVQGDTLELCVQFKPNAVGTQSAMLVLNSDSVGSQPILFRGAGLSPQVVFKEEVIDFGYVLHGSSKTIMAHYTNIGNTTAAFDSVHNSLPDFAVVLPPSISALASDSTPITVTPAPSTGLVRDTAFYYWNGEYSRVILIGFGTERGLQASRKVLEFGKVHVSHDSTLPLYLFATNYFPIIDSFAIYPEPNSVFTLASLTLPYAIKNDHDTLTAMVTYHAALEQADSATLVVYANDTTLRIPLRGKGVEAHPWISPPSASCFGLTMGSSFAFSPFAIHNAGEYPFYIDSIVHSEPAFLPSAISSSLPVVLDSTRNCTVTFTPPRARHYIDTLRFYTSAAGKVLTVALEGSGTYPPGTGPTFGYKVESRQEEVGQLDTIPVTMFGNRLNMIDADKAKLQVTFDPYMVRIRGGDAGSTSGASVQYSIRNDTATFEVPRTSFAADTILRIYTEALLGPDSNSIISVVSADPGDASTKNIDGVFSVVDCWGGIHGVVQGGAHDVSSIVPNPAGDRARLGYQLGFDGPVTLEIYNTLGLVSKRIEVASVKAGAHTLDVDLKNLPQGRYVYRLHSLEFTSEGALVILR